MSQPQDMPPSLIQFYATAPYECAYLPERTARSQVATPGHLINTEVYGELVRQGFRRSGAFTYRPWCDQCSACIPVRIPVSSFQPNRSQRRVWAKHAGLDAHELPLCFREEHFDLYRRYQHARHAGSGMDQDDHNQFARFLIESQVDTRIIEYRDGNSLRMVSVIDCLTDGLSSVYTFYDPSITAASFGTFSILWQINTCQRIGRDYLYLGYWIRDCRKMSYKKNFAPLEACLNGSWRTLSVEDLITLD